MSDSPSSAEIDEPKISPPQDETAYPQEVQIVELDERRFVLVGTAHISHSSVELVRQVIEKEKPDCVCVELDAQRFQALSEKRKWEGLDLKQVIRNKQLATLLVNLLLASYQKRLAGELGIEPGTELLEATQVAKSLGIPIELCDRDVRVTLRRAAREMSLWRKLLLVSQLLASMLEPAPELTEEQLQELKQQDVLSELMNELGRNMPELKRVLIDERDSYLTSRMKAAPGRNIVAVVGAGHLKGICSALAEDRKIDLTELDRIPPVSPIWKIIGWGIPALILGAITWIGFTQGRAEASDNILYWIMVNGTLSSVGAVLALAHPLTIASAFVAAPITSLTPVIGAGYVCAFVQAWLAPPKVKELQQVTEDAGILRRWWGNKLLRIFLVFVLTSLGSTVGTWVGGAEILSNLF